MLILYSLGWSHFVEKVIWALEYKKLEWRKVEINAFKKKELQKFPKPHYVPFLHDPEKNIALAESTSIINYLEKTYPNSPNILPSDTTLTNEIVDFMVWLDSTLGLWARRLGYTQLIKEVPEFLPKLFLPNALGGCFTIPVINNIAGAGLAMILIQRFRFHANYQEGTYHKLEVILKDLVKRLNGQQFFFGNQFTAADITVASLLRPLRIVPYFRNHADLQYLFKWQDELFALHHRPLEYPYEMAINQARKGGKQITGQFLPTRNDLNLEEVLFAAWLAKHKNKTTNDQQSVYTTSLALAPIYYFMIRHRSSWYS